MAQNAYPPPFWHKKLGAGARTSNIPPPVLIPGVGTRYTNVVGYAQTAIVRDEEVATPPIMSDLTWSTPWRQDFNHGKTLANCWVNTSYADGRVSGHKPDLVNPSMWLLGWGSSPITWYR